MRLGVAAECSQNTLKMLIENAHRMLALFIAFLDVSGLRKLFSVKLIFLQGKKTPKKKA
jgi:hypothetical protein